MMIDELISARKSSLMYFIIILGLKRDEQHENCKI